MTDGIHDGKNSNIKIVLSVKFKAYKCIGH